MITRSYDAVCLRPGGGALTAAALLAARGRQVLVVERPEILPQVGRYLFPTHHRPILGFEGGLLLPSILKALQVHPRELRLLQRARPSHQVLLPRHRVDIHADPDAFSAEMTREFGAEAGVLARFLSRVEGGAEACANGLLGSAASAGQLRWWHRLGFGKIPWNPPAVEASPTFAEAARQDGVTGAPWRFLLAQLRSFSGVDQPENLPLPYAGIPLMAGFDGWFIDAEEPNAFRALLRRRMEGLKVDFLTEADPDEAIASFRAVKELRFPSRREPVSTSTLILGEDPWDMASRLPERGGRGYRDLQGRLQPTRFRYSIYLGLRKEVVPVGMADHSLWVPRDEEEVAGINCLTLSLTPEGSGRAPEGCRGMTISAQLPLEQAEDGPALAEVGKQMLERVRELIPFLDDHLEGLHLPSPGTPSQDRPIPIDSRPSHYSLPGGPLRLPSAGGMGVHLPHRNVFYAGPASLPALGLEGEALAGMVVDRLAAAVLPRIS